jgi:hypothetical protein
VSVTYNASSGPTELPKPIAIGWANKETLGVPAEIGAAFALMLPSMSMQTNARPVTKLFLFTTLLLSGHC